MFIKWPSIENSYRQKDIDWWLEHFPQLKDETFVVTEKIHGSNAQIGIDFLGNNFFGSRNQFSDSNLFGCGEVMRDISEKIANAFKPGLSISVYGELYGDRIQKGVQYHPGKHFAAFGLRYDECWASHTEYREILARVEVPVVPELYRGTLQECLEFDTKFETLLGPHTGSNLCEGIVITPLNDYFTDQGSRFALKKKNELFIECSHAKKKVVLDDEIVAWNNLFAGYINEARLRNVLSKETGALTKRDVGRLIQALITDAKSDFLKDYPEAPQGRAVYNVGRIAAPLVIAEL